jgi:formylglycine-generating enzyme required for sulfatase activity
MCKSLFLLFCLLCASRVFSQALLEASFKPTIQITGLLGSMQQVQSAAHSQTNAWATIGFARITGNPTYFTDTSGIEGKRFYRTITIGLMDSNLVWIPPGTFVIGSPTNEIARSASEGPQTTMTLTHGFFMGRYEVRNVDYMELMTNTPVNDSGLSNYLARPVRQVNYMQATNYCAIRTALETSQGRIPEGWAYRLPTEAEWEYACRAGTTNVFNIGDQLRADSDLGIDAIFNGLNPYPPGSPTSSPINPDAPAIVGSCAPNVLGLHDMHGNVEEWCQDGPGDPVLLPYPGGSVTNYAQFIGGYTVVRGGGYGRQAKDCRSASRVSRFPTNPSSETGFRVVLAPMNPQ